MTRGAMLFPILLYVRRAEGGGADGKTGCDNDCFFHSDLRCCIVELPAEPGSALMPFKNSLALLRVPKGQTAIAQRFIARFGRAGQTSPGGTKEGSFLHR